MSEQKARCYTDAGSSPKCMDGFSLPESMIFVVVFVVCIFFFF